MSDAVGWSTVWESDTAVRDLDLGFRALDEGLGSLNLGILDFSSRKLSPFMDSTLHPSIMGAFIWADRVPVLGVGVEI